MSQAMNIQGLPPESQPGAFINFFPEELPSAVLKHQVRTWMAEQKFSVQEEDEYLAFQLGPSFAAVFFYQMPLASRAVRCLSFQAYALGRYGAQFLDDADLAAVNQKLHVGRLVRGHKQQVLFVYNVLAEGMKKAGFLNMLNTFKQGIDTTEQQIQILLSTT